LRDTISRNNLKLPDLRDPRELIRGDPLLQLDRRLSTTLDGVYRPSEIYLRLLQKLTAPNFGTRFGRWFTRFVTLPFGGALVILEGIDLIFREVYKLWGMDYAPVFGPLTVLIDVIKQRPFLGEEPWPFLETHQLYAPIMLGLLGFFLMLIINSRKFRREVGALLSHLGHGIRWLVAELPLRLVPWPVLRRFLKSWAFQIFYSVFFLPILFCLALWQIFPRLFGEPINPWRAAGVFLIVEFIFNSRPGHAAGDAVTRGGLRIFDWFRSGLLPGLLRLIIRLFKQITDSVEYVLYTVDEWLRFRTGDNRFSMVLRVLLGLVWFPVSYITRLYLVVLIEPGINPLKLPISILAAKFLYPITIAIELVPRFTQLLAPVVGNIVAHGIAWTTWWLLPDAFGFLFWETKENWRLYKANRPKFLGPISVGPRGETLLHLLQPGFHTGTLPKLYAQWRYAVKQAYETGAWRAARACRESLLEMENSFARFVEREVLVLLHQNPLWRKRPLSVANVTMASNVVHIAIGHAAFPDRALSLSFAERDGLLTASMDEPGWLPDLPPEERATLARALEGMYNLAGVNWVSETGAPPDPIKWKDWVRDWQTDGGNNGQQAAAP
jgi:hypothetical protein